ncbi:MAG: hypothetical protein DMG83_25625 [Acidobacteria bacterium]|nr:MAG: hypothetical protein DMG83_25625 [Acidobacteriota bacterium]
MGKTRRRLEPQIDVRPIPFLRDLCTTFGTCAVKSFSQRPLRMFSAISARFSFSELVFAISF